MIYSLWRDMLVKADDMPLFSQWIKKTMENVSFSIVILVEVTGIAPVYQRKTI